MIASDLQIARFASTAGLFGALLFLAPSQAFAQQNDDSPQSRIVEIQPMSFGQVLSPGAGSNLFTLNWQNNNIATAGAGDGAHLGGGSSGRYRIRGRANHTVTIGVYSDSFAEDGLELQELHLNGDDNTYSTTLDGDGVVIARLGGIVEVFSYVSGGLHEAELLITVDYE